MFKKLLVANRGEIAVRAFRAADELGIGTVAVYPHEDRASEHRFRADEAYLIGEQGRPLQAYLDIEGLLEVARRTGADAIYPGYGFLSENPELAEACRDADVVFVGPTPEVLRLAGDKWRAIEAARDAGIPTLRSLGPSTDVDQLSADAGALPFPLFVKAIAGGGGRGMRRVDHPAALADAIAACMREAEASFGDSSVFVEQAVDRPRHIEVQVLGDTAGEVAHLYERECSVQRRHQKVVEIAPAPNLPAVLRDRLCADAVAFARVIGYMNAGTVEFLVDAHGRHVFIEMNPRIQVEHTVTEEVTNTDLVQAQLRVAAGEKLADIGLTQERIRVEGAALQCRVTTENPTNSFLPDTGTVTSLRLPAGPGVRVDSGASQTGAEVSGYFDSMLAKVTCRGSDFPAAVARARRAIAEFDVGGLATNLNFLEALLAEPDFVEGVLSTSFIDEHPALLSSESRGHRSSKLMSYLADVTVNRPFGVAPTSIRPTSKLPPTDLDAAPAKGSRQALLAMGPRDFSAALREQDPVGVTDTTYRDAHQSLLATRLRTHDLVDVARHQARLTPEMLSLEVWGGATYDVALRFLGEDPWDRLVKLREAVPNICLQMLLRGRNTVGYTPYPTMVTDVFVAEAVDAGVDIFRIFDALNDVEQMEPAIAAVLESGTAVAEVALCYTGDLSDPSERLYTLDYYLRLAERIVGAGAHILAIKDMAGLLRPPAASRLVRALRERFDVPVHLHTHDTAGGQLATLVAAIDSGVDAVDAACAAMAGTTSQPPLSAVVAATDNTRRATGLDIEGVCALEPYWEATRSLYGHFEAGLAAPTGRVYTHEIPGGQISNLRQQATALGLGDRFEQVEEMYAAANEILGDVIKVTPSSKVVGDLALFLVGAGVSPTAFASDPARFDIPESVIRFLQGELGVPPGGWPEPFRTRALAGRSQLCGEEEIATADRARLESDPRKTLNELLFPGPTREYEQFVSAYGDLSDVPTREFLYGLDLGTEHAIGAGDGRGVLVSIDAIGEPDAEGIRKVVGRVNDRFQVLPVKDRAVRPAAPRRERADGSNPGHVAAPFSGVVHPKVALGDVVDVGTVVATIEAMKMEASITSVASGVVVRLLYDAPERLDGGDLILIIEAQS